VKRLGLKMALSARFGEGNVVVIDDFGLKEIKTKDFVKVMDNFKFDDCLIVTGEMDEVVAKSAKNAVGYKILPVAGLNVFDILKYSKLMFVQTSIEKLEERLMV
jgi:large subunit ribosomal protein L4